MVAAVAIIIIAPILIWQALSGGRPGGNPPIVIEIKNLGEAVSAAKLSMSKVIEQNSYKYTTSLNATLPTMLNIDLSGGGAVEKNAQTNKVVYASMSNNTDVDIQKRANSCRKMSEGFQQWD